MPVVLAFIIKLVLQPVMRRLHKWHIPNTISAALIIVALIIGIGGLGFALSGPALNWAEKLPANYPQLQERLNFLSKPVEKTQQFLMQAEGITKTSGPKVIPVAVEGNHLTDRLLGATGAIMSGLFTTMVVLFFLSGVGRHVPAPSGRSATALQG